MRIFGREISLKTLLKVVVIAGLIIVGLIAIWFHVPTPPPYTG